MSERATDGIISQKKGHRLPVLGRARVPAHREWSPQAVTSKVSTGASKSLYQAGPWTVEFPEQKQPIGRGARGPIPLGSVEVQGSEGAEKNSGTVCLDSGRAGSSSINTDRSQFYQLVLFFLVLILVQGTDIFVLRVRCCGVV